jgi:hypothetical protein
MNAVKGLRLNAEMQNKEKTKHPTFAPHAKCQRSLPRTAAPQMRVPRMREAAKKLLLEKIGAASTRPHLHVSTKKKPPKSVEFGRFELGRIEPNAERNCKLRLAAGQKPFRFANFTSCSIFFKGWS